MKKLFILIVFIISISSIAYAQEDEPCGLDCGPVTTEQQNAADTAVTNAPNTSQDSSGTASQSGTSGGSTGFVPLAPIPGLTQGATADTPGLAKFFNNLYKYLVGLGAALAVIMIIWGGLEYATQDSPGGKKEGKEKILQAILGLILILSPVLIFSIINPSILNLSLNLTELDTRSTSSTGTGTQTSSCPPYFMGTPPNCVALPVCTSTLTTMCTPRAVASFDEGPYTARPTTNLPPGGIWCYQTEVTTRPEGYNFMCYRDQPGCQASCRASGTLANGDPYPRATDPSDPTCARACVNSF